jgi:PAS domain S-box-containing protein
MKTGKSIGQQRSKPSQKPVEGLALPGSASARHDAKRAGVRGELASIVEHSNDAIFSRTFDGIITTWNAAASRIFGFTTSEIVGRSSRVLLPPGRKDEFRRLVTQMRRGRAVEHFETERMRKDGQCIHVSLTLSPIRDVSDRLVGFSTIARDITVRHQMRDALARRERELEDLFDEASVGLALVDRDGKVIRANRAFAELVNRPVPRVVGRSLKTFHANTAQLKDTLNRLARRQTFHNYPMEFLTRKGETKYVLVDANGFWEKGNFIHSRWFIRDISQRKRLERELLEISERERRRLAQDLHDGLGQQLGGIAYLSNVLRERLLEGGAPEAANAARISSLLRSAIEQVRRVARGLSPIQTEPVGLMHALRELAGQSKEFFGVHCAFDCRRPVPVHDAEVAAHLFRIAQESVNNALKHAAPRSITIRLNRARNRITLTVADDGRGIGPISPKRSGLGLRIMQYRCSLIQGTLTVRRQKRGTEVVCSAPCPEARMENTGKLNSKAHDGS